MVLSLLPNSNSHAKIPGMEPRVVFMGSPDFAVPSLKALAESVELVGVVTQPDRPAGRGRSVTPPPVKVVAQELTLPVLQPRSLRDPGSFEVLQSWRPDLCVVTAFGQILRTNVLDLPRHGCVNVHASLLPRWRGAAPIQAAILAGDKETGVTIMKMDAGVDTGPILSQRAIPIKDDDTAGSLSPLIAQLGATLLLETLPVYLSGELKPRPQDHGGATHAPMLSKADGELDFRQPAEKLARMVRAYTPWPGTFTRWQGDILKIRRAHAVNGQAGSPGQTEIRGGKPAILTPAGSLVLDEVQPAGKQRMSGDAFLRGARGWGEQRLGEPDEE